MGCGRTGAALASAFESRGHSVAVIDRTSDAFRRLAHDFEGARVTGIGFDRDTLRNAGIEEAYAFAAVSDGDNSNILAARVARETFGVERVVARIADSGRAAVYRKLGIGTVAQVPWTTAQMISQLLPSATEDVYTDPEAEVSLRRIAISDGWAGLPYAQAESASGARLAYVNRLGTGIVADHELLIQDGDAAYFVCPTGDLAVAEKTLAKPPAKPGTAKRPKATRKGAAK